MMITEEKLMAYADNELAEDERARVDEAVATNDEARRLFAAERLLRQRLAVLYEPALHEDVPERLRRRLDAGERVGPFAARPGSAPRPSWWDNVTAIAATLVVGLVAGYLLTSPLSPGPAASGTVAEGELGRALDVQLASAQPADAPVQLGISFVDQDGNPCRTFRSPDLVGIACRRDGRWALRLTAPAERTASFEYQQAGGTSALIMKSAQELMAGEPMGAPEERAARDSGWPRVQR